MLSYQIPSPLSTLFCHLFLPFFWLLFLDWLRSPACPSGKLRHITTLSLSCQPYLDKFFPFIFLHRSLCAAIVPKVSPSCVKTAANSVSSPSSRFCAITAAKTLISPVSSKPRTYFPRFLTPSYVAYTLYYIVKSPCGCIGKQTSRLPSYRASRISVACW